METSWFINEETFVRMNYKILTPEKMALILNKPLEDIKEKLIEYGLLAEEQNKVSEISLEIPKQMVMTEVETAHKEIKKRIRPAYKYIACMNVLIDEINKKMEDETSLINIYDLCRLWDTGIRQTRKYLYDSIENENFPYKVKERDVYGFYKFVKKKKGENTGLPPYKNCIVKDKNLIKNIEKVPLINWTSNTDIILNYIVNKLKNEPTGFVCISNKEITNATGISSSAIRSHISVIDNAPDCIIQRSVVRIGSISINQYKFKEGRKYEDNFKGRYIKD